MKDKRTIILLLLALSQFLVVLDSAVVNVALPAIKDALHFSDSALQWVVTAYILTFGGFLLLGGRAADLYGRRNVLVAGMVGFTVVSLLLGLAPNGPALVALRALQGIAAAFMSPAAMSILLTTFAEGNERNKALGVWSTVASGGAAAGVFLGGVLTQYLGWQWNFFVNVPIGIAAIIGVLAYVPAHIQEAKDKHLDMPGALLITSGLMALVYGLTQAPEAGWLSVAALLPIGLSAALITAFVINETRVAHPLIPLRIFRIRNVMGANLLMLPVIAGGLGLFFFASLYLQHILHYSPVESGLAFLPIPILIGIVSNKAAQLIGKVGFKPLLITGTALVGIGMFILSLLTEHSSYMVHLLPAFILIGVGMGLAFVSATVAATSGVPPHEAGLASGLINTSNQVGAALGIAILAVVASATTAGALASGHTATAATLSGYQYAFLTAAALLGIALLIAIFVIRAPKATGKKPAAASPAIH